jgi:phage terminase large subunit
MAGRRARLLLPGFALGTKEISGAEEIDIALYAPRPHQELLHDSLKRFSVLVAHRRFGKTVFCINELIARAAGNPRPEPRYAYVAPYLAQAKDVAWNYLKRYTAPIPGQRAMESELRVDLPSRDGTGARIGLYGADNAERLRGLYFDGVVLDEFALMHPRVWPEIIRPMLTDRMGWALFIGTPMGRNHFARLFAMAEKNESWFAAGFKASETGILPEEELLAAQAEMTEDQYAQEFECSFDAAIPGAYYAGSIAEAEAEKRIGNVPYERASPVHTAWDLGIGDATAIWFCQQVGMEVRLIDYYEASGVGLDHYARVLQEKPYVYGEHILPHDAAVKELGTGKSRLETLRSLGLKGRVIPAQSIEDGINAARLLIPRCWFDKTKCERGIEALRQYRTEYDDRLKTFRNRPLHDWSSHACFVGETAILTRNGMCQIMNLPETGEILTSCGWKAYVNPRITRTDAQLVEVRFNDGLMVKCTPDHLFKTKNGWKFAASLSKHTVIQSSLMNSRNISMADFIDFGPASGTLLVAAKAFIEMYGKQLLGRFQMAVTFITEMITQRTICLAISNVCPHLTISRIHGEKTKRHIERAVFQLRRKKPLPNGTNRQKVDFGISVMQNDQSHGSSGNEKKQTVPSAVKNLWQSFVTAVTLKNFARRIAKPLRIESVRKISEKSDVYCLTVPDAAEFSLANGALVHNCDAFRYLALGLRPKKSRQAPAPEAPSDYDPLSW